MTCGAFGTHVSVGNNGMNFINVSGLAGRGFGFWGCDVVAVFWAENGRAVFWSKIALLGRIWAEVWGVKYGQGEGGWAGQSS